MVPGKSNSIAWLAHQLASFYWNPDDTERLFDSIVVVTDRRGLERRARWVYPRADFIWQDADSALGFLHG